MHDDEERFVIAFRRDVWVITKDASSCFVHSVTFFVVLTVLSVEYSIALSTALLVGAAKIFGTDTDTCYWEHTRKHVARRFSRDNGDHHDSGV